MSINKLPIKTIFIRKIANSKFFLWSVIFLSMVRLIKFYKENNLLCLGIFLIGIISIINKKRFCFGFNYGKRIEMSIALIICITITSFLCIREGLENEELIQTNEYKLILSKCEEEAQSEKEVMEDIEVGIDICNLDIEELEKKEEIAVGATKESLNEGINKLNEIKIQFENKKKLLEIQIKKDKEIEKIAYVISPPDLSTGGNRPIKSKTNHDKEIPKDIFKEKNKIESIGGIGPSKWTM